MFHFQIFGWQEFEKSAETLRFLTDELLSKAPKEETTDFL